MKIMASLLAAAASDIASSDRAIRSATRLLQQAVRLGACSLALAAGSAQAQDGKSTAFFNVRVETMTDRGSIDVGYVVIREGRIVAVGDGQLPANFIGVRIDGRGRTLMPGLADMHAHYDEADMGIAYVANGITLVRNLTGTLQSALLDQSARTGAVIGPRVETSGPIINAFYFTKTDTPDQVIGAVRSQARSGFRAVKLYHNLSAEAFRAAVAEARANRMKVYCHVPFAMSVQEVLALKVDSIEHLTGYGERSAGRGYQRTVPDAWNEDWVNVDRSRFGALAKLTAESGTWMVPTFALTYGSIYSADPKSYFARPESAFLSPASRRDWDFFAKNLKADRPFVARALDAKIAFVGALRKANANVLIGTDSPNPFVTPGFSIHDELAAFARAGYSNREILRIATVEAARFIGETGTAGIVAPGARADLIMLTHDPNEDLKALRSPAGVMLNGFWYDRAIIDQTLAERAIAGLRKRDR